MPFRFRKSFRLAPGLRVNLSKSGIGFSAGPRGLKLSSGPRGQRLNVTLPGTGVSYSTRLGGRRSAPASPNPSTRQAGCGSRILIGGLATLATLLGCAVLAQLVPPPGPSPTATAISTLEPVAVQNTATPTLAPPTAIPLPEPSPTAVATLAARAAEVLALVPTDTPPVDLPTATPSVMSAPTSLPTETPAPPTATPSLPQVTVNSNINVRQGPGTEYAILGSSSAGLQYPVIGRDSSGAWWAIDFHGQTGWVFGELVTVSGAEAVPVVESPALPAAAAPAQAEPAPEQPLAADQNQPAQSAESNPNAFTCIGGCATPPDPSCNIKGNVNSKGEKIYHTPSSNWYTRTDIKPEEGDRWFCTVEEAQAAGFRAPLN